MGNLRDEKLAKKQKYFDKLITLIETKSMALIISVDHVGSYQLQKIRLATRGKATILMGKNTMIRTGLRRRIEELGDDPAVEGFQQILNIVRGNIGFIFVEEGHLDEVRKIVDTEKVPAAAKTGIIAPCDVFLPAGPTGLDPSSTNFFQALNIGTKIVKGQIELNSEVHLVKKDIKVGSSECVLLQKLNIKPFEYGVKTLMCYQDGSVFDKAVLDLSNDDIIQKFLVGVSNVAAFGREVGIPTSAGVPHYVVNAFKNIAALVSDLEFTFKEVETVKEFLKDPSKFASAGGGGGAPAAGGAAPAETKAAAAPVVEEEEEEDMDFDLFG